MKHLGSSVRRVAASAVAAAGAVLLVSGMAWPLQEGQKGHDWPQFLGPNHDGTSSETGWSTAWEAAGPKRLWELNVGAGYACASTSNGRAYTLGNANDTDTVLCLDGVTGKEIWKQPYACKAAGEGHPGPRCSPTIDDGLVYTVSIEGHIKCWDAQSGKPVWSKTAGELGGKAGGWGFACSPLVLGEKVIVDVGLLAALEKKTGNVVWKTAGYTAGYSSPVAFKSGEAQMLAIFTGDGLKVFAAADGKPVAALPWKTSYDVNAAIPIISEAGIFITSGYGRGGALLKLEGGQLTKVWENKELSSHFATPVLLNGHLYGVSGNVEQGPLKCIELKTGTAKWTHKGDGSVVLVGGKLLVLGTKGRLAVVQPSPDGYKEIAATDLGPGNWWNAPVLSHGLIYCRSNEGTLVCLDVRK
jgi:outer membrane protein assembly factor BamB